MAEKLRALRVCGHPIDAVLYWGRPDGKIALYCLPCLAERVGLQPCEIVSPEDFVERYWKPAGEQR
jgi:hypothetical protein